MTMRWRLDREHPAAWSAAGGVVLAVATSAAIALPLWEPFALLAIVGFYVLVAPLVHAGPWRSNRHTSDPARPGRVELLREQHRKGRSLQRTLVWAGGIPETPQQASEAEDDAQYKAAKWGDGAWRVIAEHFPGHEKPFFGEGHPALGSTGFVIAAMNEMQRLGRSADSYLESKLDFIEALLRRYDA